jgi:tetratricopeptide (TPR) repeat protein
MKYPLVLGCTAALVFCANPAIAKSPAEIEKIVRSVSVEIQVAGSDRVGSGSIVHRQGNLYTLITNRHVACGSGFCKLPTQQTYNLRTFDGQRYQVPVTGVKLLGKDLDLAIVQFRSNRSYPVAQVAESGSLKVGAAVYTAGFPKGQGFLFGAGDAKAVVNKRLTGDKGGYTIVYDAETLPGMSGGGAFDNNGRLVAVHGVGDRYTENTETEEVSSNIAKAEVNSKIGYNRGIPVRWVVQNLGELGILVGNRRPLNQNRIENPAGVATADAYFIAGFNKWVEPGADFRSGRKAAVAQFSQAIKLNSRYTAAYFMRAIVQDQLKAYSQALADFNKAIALNPKFAKAYYNRALLKDEKLNDIQGALADYNKAIALNPKFAKSYNNRALLKYQKLNDISGALADFNQAISLNPQYALAYNNRGGLKEDKLNDMQGALADYNKAIALNPKFAKSYNNRALLKYQLLNDPRGALADFDRAISLNPKYILAYNNRGSLKYQKLNDISGALADFNQAISLNPKFALVYYNRGSLKDDKLNDAQGALADYSKAIALNPKDVESYNNRGILRYQKMNDPQGALADFNKAIALNPKFANTYYNRGNLKKNKLNDRPGAIGDYRAAARIFRQQGQTSDLKDAIEQLRALGATE